jgi:hypothetical protein
VRAPADGRPEADDKRQTVTPGDLDERVGIHKSIILARRTCDLRCSPGGTTAITAVQLGQPHAQAIE